MARLLTIAVLVCALALAGCSLNDEQGGTPGAAPKARDGQATRQLGFPAATKNTTRIPGADPAEDAAGAASAVFPATSAASRPHAVALVDRSDWAGAIAAAVLMARPLEAPTLLTDGGGVPSVTRRALERLSPRGADLARGAQVIRIGSDVAAPDGYRSTVIEGSDPFALAAAVDRFASAVRGRPTSEVMVASGERADFAMPAAAYAARAGVPILYARQSSLPAATRRAIQTHDRPDIYVIGPEQAIGKAVERQLAALGAVHRIEGPTPVETAIALARYRHAGFGWGITVPGQNFTLARASRPLDAAAAATLGGRGVFAPLLVTYGAATLPRPLESYLLDVQPGYQDDPNDSVFNHVWILGDESAVSAGVQGRLDEITELVPVQLGRP